jgi:hypothetical protein
MLLSWRPKCSVVYARIMTKQAEIKHMLFKQTLEALKKQADLCG